jgi:hypothetical protein
MNAKKLLGLKNLSKAERAKLRQAIEVSKLPAEVVSSKRRLAAEMERREEQMMAVADEREQRGPMAHEVTIISDAGIEVGVVEGDSIRVTARPAQQ